MAYHDGRGRLAALSAGLLVAMLAGCAGLGPTRVGIDRMDYTERLRESEKEQLLSNIVALRYGDAPMFLGVSSVISQYTRESSGELTAALSPGTGNDAGSVGGAVVLRETPTVTYTPVTGDRFSRHLLAPLPPAAVLAMMEAGWASDLLFPLAVRSVNGVGNTSRAPLFEQKADDDFAEVVAVLRRLQRTQALAVRVRQKEETFSALARVRPALTAQEEADLQYLSERLGIRRGVGELRVVFATYPHDTDELAIATRSMFEILMELAQGVEVEGVPVSPEPSLVRIRSGIAAPADAHVAAQFRGRWYWIDGHDEASKQMFLITQVMLSIADTGGGAGSPLVTIPAG
ncbi:hypothetical protein [Pseudoxanthomonas suwonensis]|uniref:Lipoprotein n=1 Tax=Pseudoxanthomonas suwonensis TaxID=314722 RepID=A0A0E3Z0N4_9GAMM|nr:hypothetical protein [Pseudoxanthomonas suwonensis]AKC86244.1 hypothetical protein WQ53_05095 [Pseudoxanthomonas suwonensis]